MNREIISGVLEEFMPLCAIPHGSGNEKAVSDYLANRLAALGALVKRDAIWNIWADVPATSGREGEPTIALQAHMDMVCAVGEPDYRPHTDPVAAVEKDGWLSTGGRSSLGADCGAGVALILWLLGHAPSHPPLRVIFTVREEIGLAGAQEIPKESVAGVSAFVNLDGFAQDRVLTGSAGGMREHYARQMETVPAPAGKAYQITLTGFTGGHSGFDIDKKRVNAVILMGEVLRRLQTKTPFAIVSFAGGQAFNAIPYRCTAWIVSAVPIDQAVREIAEEIAARHKATDPDGILKAERCPHPGQVWAGSVTAGFLTLLGGFTDGVYAMHPELPGVVSDSSNLGHVYEQGGVLYLDAMIRFMDAAAEYALHQSHMLVANMCGFAGIVRTRYPAWPAKRDSALVQRMVTLYKGQTGKDAQVVAQHVGLEPSFFLDKNPEMDCVCLGMDIEGCHSPDERWRLDSIPTLAHMLLNYFAAP